MRKRYSPEFKAQVEQELLLEQEIVSQLAAEYRVHPNQLCRWRERCASGPGPRLGGDTLVQRPYARGS